MVCSSTLWFFLPVHFLGAISNYQVFLFIYFLIFLQSNTILSSVSSLFTFLVSLAFLDEKFTFLKLISVLLCMGGTIIVSLGDSTSEGNEISSKPLLGDILALVSAGLYSVYITLIRKKIPDEDKGEGQASMAQFLGFVGLFNLLIFLPVALILNFTKLEPFHKLSWKQFVLIVGKGTLFETYSSNFVSTAFFFTFSCILFILWYVEAMVTNCRIWLSVKFFNFWVIL